MNNYVYEAPMSGEADIHVLRDMPWLRKLFEIGGNEGKHMTC